jgi:hypothetical protein
MLRFARLLLLPLAACTSMPAQKTSTEAGNTGFTGTVQKVFRVVRRGADLPGIRLLGKEGSTVGSAFRHNAETHQYIVRTPGGQIIAQSDEEFPVGECVTVIPEANSSGPAFPYGEAAVVKSESCRG